MGRDGRGDAYRVSCAPRMRSSALDAHPVLWQCMVMALPYGLIRVADVARELGVDHKTIASWCRRLGVELGRAPVRGMPGAQPAGHETRGPLYVHAYDVARLLDALLPGAALVAERKRYQLRLRRVTRRHRDSARGVENEYQIAR